MSAKHKSLNDQPIRVILLAAGQGTRLAGERPKQYIEIAARTILARSIDIFTTRSDIAEICVVIDPAHEVFYAPILEKLDKEKIVISCIYGGKTRQESVSNALMHFKNDPTHLTPEAPILIHDAARPFVQKRKSTILSPHCKRRRR